jgi:hypothetical protein
VKLSTDEILSGPGRLPENWGPIFGLSGITDQLGDLSWLGEAYADQGWVQVEGEASAIPTLATPAELVWEKAKELLRQSDWSMLPDVPMTVGDKQAWIEYRAALRNIRSQTGFPDVNWPVKPE